MWEGVDHNNMFYLELKKSNKQLKKADKDVDMKISKRDGLLTVATNINKIEELLSTHFLKKFRTCLHA